MAEPIITLTTDFGAGSPYVAVMKGVILGINPAVRLVDITHTIPPQDIRHAAFVVSESLPFFPAGAIHIVVVDPGVGTARALLHIEAGGHQLLAPDNGCWTLGAERLSSALAVRRLTESRYWRHPVSTTFHGRDVLAPVAARLSLGLPAAELGPVVADWVRLPKPRLTLAEDRLEGEVVHVDEFGNLLTSIPGGAFERIASKPVHVRVGGHEAAAVVRTYGDARRGEIVALVSSSGCLEIAAVEGSAARALDVGPGAAVEVFPRTDRP